VTIFQQGSDVRGTGRDVIMTEKIADFISELEFVADINEYKDCLMNQDNTQDDPAALWFNIDVPKGHGLSMGDRVRIIIEKVE